jgi:hypothetical protein
VKILFALRFMLAMLALAGILVAPVAAPAAAGTSERDAIAHMAGDMPCCPDEKPAVPDCGKTCPVMAACVAKCLQDAAIAGSDLKPPVLVALLVPSNDAPGASLLQEPLPKPPRT